MNKVPYKLSIPIITYNQEKEIGRALDSLLCQKEYIYEILVGDDCSKDSTRAIIMKYVEKYPELIKPVFREKNLGIFGNQEDLYSRVSGNIVLDLSGDDEMHPDYLRHVDTILQNNQLNYDCDCFLIVSNTVYKTSKTTTIHKSVLKKGVSFPALKLRGMLLTYGLVRSISVVKKQKPVRKDIGIFADGLLDLQPFQNTKMIFHSNTVGYIYYKGEGVSVKTDVEKRKKSYVKLLKEYYKLDCWTNKDKHFIRFKFIEKKFYSERKFKYFFSAITECIKSTYWNTITNTLFQISIFSVKALVHDKKYIYSIISKLFA